MEPEFEDEAGELPMGKVEIRGGDRLSDFAFSAPYDPVTDFPDLADQVDE